MKLIDKMAESYARKIVKEDCSPLTGDWVNIAHDWKQGFNAAREIAAQQWDKVANETVFGPMDLVDVTRGIAKSNAERLRNMGEEEV